MDGSLGEAIMRAAVQEAFPAHSIVKARSIPWLRNNRLEFDCYNDELRLALEYQGIQHYEYVPHFHGKDRAKLELLQQRDAYKREATLDNWFVLIEVPYTIPYTRIRAYVHEELRSLGYDLITPGKSDEEFMRGVCADGTRAVVMLE